MKPALIKQLLLVGLPTMFAVLLWAVFSTLAIDGWRLYLALVVVWIGTAGNLSTLWAAYETRLRLGKSTLPAERLALAVTGRYLLVPIAMLIVYTTGRQYGLLFPGWPALLAGAVTYYLAHGLASRV